MRDIASFCEHRPGRPEADVSTVVCEPWSLACTTDPQLAGAFLLHSLAAGRALPRLDDRVVCVHPRVRALRPGDRTMVYPADWPGQAVA
ncbi:MAG TPA: hypothetical protein VGB14_06140 [Acidimicrobiales bacterium]|jgi:hypothetical protein